MDFTESEKALKILIEGETSASYNYKCFSKKAEEEGFEGVAALFRALAEAEMIHIKNHKRALGKEYTPVAQKIAVLDTRSNLISAISGEKEENRKLYPSLIKRIKKETRMERGKVARLTMVWAQKAEAIHAKLLKEALKAIDLGKDLAAESILICRVCGNVILNENGQKECAVCGHDFIFFEKADK